MANVIQGTKVRFHYIPAGMLLPQVPDDNTIYFVEDEKAVYVGSTLFADYKKMTVDVQGSGDDIVDLLYTPSTDVLTIVRGDLGDKYATKSEVDNAEDNANSYTDQAIENITHPEYSVIELDTVGNYHTVYQLQKDGVDIGVPINIPKSQVIYSSSVETVMADGSPYPGAVVGDKYIDMFTGGDISDPDNHIYIPVSELVDVYTAGRGLSVSNTNVITHDSISDNTPISLFDTDVSDPSIILLKVKSLIRDTMGHLISSTSDSKELLTKSGVESLIENNKLTWEVIRS